MENIRWICIKLREPWQNNDWYNESTLEFTRKKSKENLLENSSMDWKEAKTYGWRCIKVKVTITTL